MQTLIINFLMFSLSWQQASFQDKKLEISLPVRSKIHLQIIFIRQILFFMRKSIKAKQSQANSSEFQMKPPQIQAQIINNLNLLILNEKDKEAEKLIDRIPFAALKEKFLQMNHEYLYSKYRETALKTKIQQFMKILKQATELRIVDIQISIIGDQINQIDLTVLKKIVQMTNESKIYSSIAKKKYIKQIQIQKGVSKKSFDFLCQFQQKCKSLSGPHQKLISTLKEQNKKLFHQIEILKKDNRTFFDDKQNISLQNNRPKRKSQSFSYQGSNLKNESFQSYKVELKNEKPPSFLCSSVKPRLDRNKQEKAFIKIPANMYQERSKTQRLSSKQFAKNCKTLANIQEEQNIHQEELRSLKMELKRAQEQQNQNKIMIDNLKQSLDRQKSQKGQFKLLLEQLKAKNEEKQKRIGKLQALIAQLQEKQKQQIQAMKKEKQYSSSNLKRYVEFKKKIEENAKMQKRLKNMQEYVKQCEGRLEAEKNRYKHLQAEKDFKQKYLSQQNDKIQVQVDEKRRELNRVKAQEEKNMQRIRELSNHLKQTQKVLVDQRYKNSKTQEELKIRCQKLQKSKVQLFQQTYRLKNQYNKLKQSYQRSQKQIEKKGKDLQDKLLREIQQEKEKGIQLQRQVKTLSNQKYELINQLQKQKQKNIDNHKIIEKLQKDIQDLQKKQSEQTKIFKDDAQIQRQLQIINNYEAIMKDLHNKKQQIIRLSQQNVKELANAQSQNKQLKQLCKNLQKNKQMLKIQVKNSKRQLQKMINQIDIYKKNLKSLQSLNSQLATKNNILREALEKKQKQILIMLDYTQKYQNKINNLKEQNFELSRNIDILNINFKQLYENSQKQSTKVNNKIKDLQTQNETLRKNNRQLEDHLNHIQIENGCKAKLIAQILYNGDTKNLKIN